MQLIKEIFLLGLMLASALFSTEASQIQKVQSQPKLTVLNVTQFKSLRVDLTALKILIAHRTDWQKHWWCHPDVIDACAQQGDVLILDNESSEILAKNLMDDWFSNKKWGHTRGPSWKECCAILDEYGPLVINIPHLRYSNITILIAATRSEWTTQEFEELLQVPGIDINLGEPSALHWVAFYGNKEKMEILLKYGANINQKINIDEDTFVMSAAGAGFSKMVFFILCHGADGAIQNKKGENLYDIIKKKSTSREAVNLYVKEATAPLHDHNNVKAIVETIIAGYLGAM